MLPTVAIIMRAKDEMPHVQKALEVLGRQTFTAFTLHGVDSGSSDGTLELLQQHCDKLTQILPEEYAPGKVLNDAIRQTDQRIIVLLNADAIPLSNTWLENLVIPIIGREYEAVYCQQKPRPDAHFIVRSDYERAYNSNHVDPGFFSAAACSFRRELWKHHHFRETGYAEDRDWAAACLADGARIGLLKNCPVEHSHNYSLSELYQKRRRQAVTLQKTPSAARAYLDCAREIIRDLLTAAQNLKLHTIPYNLAYRLAIYKALLDSDR